MTGKKVEFLKKPTPKETSQFIDEWVSGNVKLPDNIHKLKRTTIFLPDWLHKKLKIEAANQGASMTELIREALEKHVR